MEILVLILLYYLSQNPDFPDSVKPLMGQLKNSEKMLSFLNDLSAFAQSFGAINKAKKEDGPSDKQECDDARKKAEEEKEKPPQSPTAGIADDFIQKILEGYLQKH